MAKKLPKFNLGVHFLTAVTFRRRPFFRGAACANLFCEELETARADMGFHVMAFVVMPDHVHLLLWWDADARPKLTISRIAWAVKGRSARRIVDYLKAQGVGDGTAFAYPLENLLQSARKPQNRPHYRNWRYKVWQQGAGYDFNIYTERKLQEKIGYIHANPVRAGLADRPEAWPWSSAANYAGVPPAHPVTVTWPFG